VTWTDDPDPGRLLMVAEYKMWHRSALLKPEEAKLLIDEVEGRGLWREYRADADDNGMAVHQWIHDLAVADRGHLYKAVWAAMTVLNKSFWDFDIRGYQQPLRVARYTAGLSHDWHVDHTPQDRSKLAFSCALNADYEGGDLQILEGGRVDRPQPGEATWFPAFQGHRVTPVTAGTRYVLLGWFTGPRFR
jgi:predicted 2-oxoglutarate/Fe(II)-dependent dioxygenase YbiX